MLSSFSPDLWVYSIQNTHDRNCVGLLFLFISWFMRHSSEWSQDIKAGNLSTSVHLEKKT